MDFDDYSGANYEALAALSQVGGVDYVGATPQYSLTRPMAASALAPQAVQRDLVVRAIGLKAIQEQAKIQRDRKLRNAALSGYVPQTIVAVSTAAGTTIAAGGALALSAAAGVPCRPTKYIVEPAIASFFGIASITAARMNMIAGGTGLVPATRFLPTAVQAPIDNPELGGGVPIVVAGANTDGGAHPYFSAFDVIDLTQASARMT